MTVVSHPGGHPAAELLTRVAASAADRELAGVDLDRAVAAIERLGRVALASMLDALRRRGLFATAGDRHSVHEVLTRAGVAPEHRGLIRRWLTVLTREGLLTEDDGGLRATPGAADGVGAGLGHTWGEVEGEWRATMGAALTIEYARLNAERLPELMTGAVHAFMLLFPEGGMHLARALYRESVTARYQHRAVGALVGEIARWPRPDRRPARILEVGAGTGATAEAVLPALAGTAADYLYTDVSRYFLDRAREWLRDRAGVRFARFDIDAEPGGQGFAPGSFDIVIGGGVLNAARDTDASVRWLAGLLAPGGWLVLSEPTVEESWVMTSLAFMMPEADDDRAATGSTFLSLGQWNAVLDGAGLRRAVSLPGAGHPLERLGHRVFAATTGDDPGMAALDRADPLPRPDTEE